MEVGAVGASDREDSTSRDTGRRLRCKTSVWLMPASGQRLPSASRMTSSAHLPEADVAAL